VREGTKLVVSPSPHVKDAISVRGIMSAVIVALIPATVSGIYLFGLHALAVIIASILSAVGTEFVALKLMGRKFVMDGSAVLTGLLLALCLPPTVPLWMPIVGAAFGIAIGKCAFGGLGHNIFNPALVGRVFLALSWPALMTRWVAPFDAVSTATPLAKGFGSVPIFDLFVGNVAGCIGETSALAILIGGAFLIAMRYIDWRVPLFYIGTVGFLMLFLGQNSILNASDLDSLVEVGKESLFHMFAGGLFLGAFFMATDYVTTPMTKLGRIIFAVGAGILVVAIRTVGGYPEGVAFSILIMNGFTPLIDRVIKPRVYGTKRGFVGGG